MARWSLGFLFNQRQWTKSDQSSPIVSADPSAMVPISSSPGDVQYIF